MSSLDDDDEENVVSLELGRKVFVMKCQACQETHQEDPAGREMAYASPLQRSASVRM
jgi:hypothetical protein